MIYVDKIKFKPKSVVDKLYIEQKRRATLNQCRHLKEVRIDKYDLLDFKTDEVITVEGIVCVQCGKALTTEELKQRDETLKRFNKK